MRKNDLDRPVRIGSQGARVAVGQLKVLRDTYFTVAVEGQPYVKDLPGFRANEPETWREYHAAPVACHYVRSGHYFVLGDNSAASSDSRTWGLVPREKLVGKVLARYFPLKRMGSVD